MLTTTTRMFNGAHTRGGRSRLHNPSPMMTLFGVALGAVALGGGYALYKELYPSGRTAGNLTADQEKKLLEQYILVGGTVGLAPDVVADIQQPIVLQTTEGKGHVPWLAINSGGGPEAIYAAVFGPDVPTLNDPNQYVNMPEQIEIIDEQGQHIDYTYGSSATAKGIADLVTDTTGDFTRAAYEYALSQIGKDQNSWGQSRREETILKILTYATSGIDWTKAFKSMDALALADTLRTAVYTLGQVAVQSMTNKR